MSPRDPRSRPPGIEHESAREQTQSLDVELPSDAQSSLAVGTSEERTRVDSPNARNNPPPYRPPTRPATADLDDPELRLGHVLGTYRLRELLGKGGMGYVYRAEHIKLGREVALKLLRGDYARRREAVNRFFQEAKTVNRVRHRNIVDVTDFVELDDGTTFIIMELLRGTSLGKWASSGIELLRVLSVLIQICDGLGAAHEVGVVHRDLKPDNLVVTTVDGVEVVKLLDFGVAKLVNRDDEDVGFQTQAGSVIGTPAYMSPEQAGGMAVDQRSDIYSLGAIIYELFCGQPLFRGRSFGEYVRRHLTEVPIPPHDTPGGANIDPRLEALILRCLAKEPDDRFKTILELRDRLLELRASIESQPARSSTPPRLLPSASASIPQPSSPSASRQPSVVGTPLSHSQRSATEAVVPVASLRWLWLGGVVCFAGIGIAVALWYANHRGPAPAPSPAPIAMPIVTAQPPDAPTLIELHFDSLPSGGVYADGHSAELCSTPCMFNVDPKDGDAQDHRTFVVRSAGYRDKSITVDLTGAERAFHVTLEPVVPDAGKKHPKLPRRHP